MSEVWYLPLHLGSQLHWGINLTRFARRKYCTFRISVARNCYVGKVRSHCRARHAVPAMCRNLAAARFNARMDPSRTALRRWDRPQDALEWIVGPQSSANVPPGIAKSPDSILNMHLYIACLLSPWRILKGPFTCWIVKSPTEILISLYSSEIECLALQKYCVIGGHG
jgi:hypothetical protein